MLKNFLIKLLLLLPLAVQAAPKAEAWPYWQAHDADSTRDLDHRAWTDFLGRNLDSRSSPHLLAYGRVNDGDRALLDRYLLQLQALRPQTLNRAQQQAYWINLYNAATVQLILQNFPVKSITKIRSGFFSFGPWDRKLLQVDKQALSLNDIEHRILRPLFRDPRIHYALNCASLGCPDLSPVAYTAAALEQMLEQGATDFINHPRGVSIRDGRLIVSSIYDWFSADFGGNETGVLQHLRKYADAELKQRLARVTQIDDYHYDWGLNLAP